MRGFPKRINTAQDIENSLELVQAGQLDAVQLQEALQAIERRAFLHVPIVEIAVNRRTVTTRFCNEAVVGEAGNVTITRVTHREAPEGDEAGGMEVGFAYTDMVLAAPLPEGETEILIPAETSPLVEMGLGAAKFTQINKAVEVVAVEAMRMRGVATV